MFRRSVLATHLRVVTLIPLKIEICPSEKSVNIYTVLSPMTDYQNFVTFSVIFCNVKLQIKTQIDHHLMTRDLCKLNW
jgi:hypothetical protein